MKIIHFTDIHLSAPGQTIGGRDPNANFERALQDVLTHHRDAELMVITGDLSDWGDEADYVRLRERLSKFHIPTKLCIGNHDDRATFLKVFPDQVDENGFVQAVVDTSAGRCLLLDTWEPETHAGHFCAKRRAWLDGRLKEHDGPFFLFLHHNPMPTHIGPMDQIGLLDGTAFREIVGRHSQRIRHIFFGHCHLPLSGSVAGVPATGIRGTNHAGYPNFAETVYLTASDLPEAYGVVFADPESVTVHMVEYGYNGEIRAENTPRYADWQRETMTR